MDKPNPASEVGIFYFFKEVGSLKKTEKVYLRLNCFRQLFLGINSPGINEKVVDFMKNLTVSNNTKRMEFNPEKLLEELDLLKRNKAIPLDSSFGSAGYFLFSIAAHCLSKDPIYANHLIQMLKWPEVKFAWDNNSRAIIIATALVSMPGELSQCILQEVASILEEDYPEIDQMIMLAINKRLQASNIPRIVHFGDGFLYVSAG
ncbi:MAG: hypothetical protein PHF35_01660 [Candidatus Moranbacteria bacterium]|nr:hypothetical protein [Candidatus Moranbacteria bacterium]